MGANDLFPYPQGWYCLVPSKDLSPGQSRAITFCGNEYVLYRGDSGQATAMDAYCPHLGAHLGHGGNVVGDDIECPFHAFRFNAEGNCTATGYDTPPPSECSLRTLPVIERDGLILAWHDPTGAPPTWEVPQFEEGAWSHPQFSEFELNSHPQETTENSVDLGHLTIVHGYGAVTETEHVEIEQQRLTTRYQMKRKNPFGIGPNEVLVNYTADVHGLGVSVVWIDVQPFNIQLRLYILPTPMKDGFIKLRAGVSIRHSSFLQRLFPISRLNPVRWTEGLVQELALRGITEDVSQDFDIWEHKEYMREPRLVRGDGPIGRYRVWCRQFYPEALARTQDVAE